MPYIITAGRTESLHDSGADDFCIRSRHAVATLEEARDHVHGLGASYGAMAHLDCVLDGTSHMPIGPLPDGTVIEVRQVKWDEIRAGITSGPWESTPGDGGRGALDAYNANTPLPIHGPRSAVIDCGCGWGRLCDAPTNALCGARRLADNWGRTA